MKRIDIDGIIIFKINGLWCKEGGDGELYPLYSQKEINEKFEITTSHREASWAQIL